MFNSSNCYSLADIAAATGNGNNNNNGDGMWGNGAWWIVILFLFVFCGWGNNGNGWGNNGGNGANSPAAQGALTRADLCSEFSFNNLDRAVTGIQQGLCDGFYAMNTGLLNGFNGVDNAICNLGYQTQSGFNSTNVALMQGQNALATQLADCCCSTKSAIKDVQFANQVGQNAIQTQLAQCCCDLGNQVTKGFCDTNYNMATNTTAIIQNSHNDTDRVIAKLDAMEMSRKDETIAALREKLTQANFSASQAAQNAFIQANQEAQTAELLRRTGHDCPTAAYVVQPPMPVTFPTSCCGNFNGWGYNNGGCGCNSGCCN